MSTQFNDKDKETIKDILGLLVELGATPAQAYQQVNTLIEVYGWTFAYFNDIEDFWIIDNKMK